MIDTDSIIFKGVLVLLLIIMLWYMFANINVTLNTTSRFYDEVVDECKNKILPDCNLSKCSYNKSATLNKCKKKSDLYFKEDGLIPIPIFNNTRNIINIGHPVSGKPIIFNHFEHTNNTHVIFSNFNGNSMSTYFFIQIPEGLTESNYTILSLVTTTDNINIFLNKDGQIKINDSPKDTIVLDPEKLYFMGINVDSNAIKIQVIDENGDIKNGDTKIKDSKIVNVIFGAELDDGKAKNGFEGIIQKIDSNNLKYKLTSESEIKLLSGFQVSEFVSSDSIFLNQIDIEVPSAIDVSATVLENECELYWLRPERGSNNISTYLIVLNQILKNNNNIRKYFVHNNDGCTNCKYKLKNLDYGVYEIAVVGINNVGTGKVTEKLKRIEIRGDKLVNDIKNDNLKYVSCRQDGSYLIGDSCVGEVPIKSDFSHSDKNIINHLLDRNKTMNFSLTN